ncbi:hypothetical protein [Amycolatopsis sp. NPDC051061]|uniref:hypothetical protein n=1 Tax=Amycolatopsis sp. NPDC051061 TaxID=3155042 RepID=UPI00342D5A8E
MYVGEIDSTGPFVADQSSDSDVPARRPAKPELNSTSGSLSSPQVVLKDHTVATVVELLVDQGASLGESDATVSVSSRTGCNCR